MTTPLAPAQQTGSSTGSKGATAPPPTRPFRAGTFRTLVQDGYQQAVTLSTTTQTLAQYSPTPNAYIRGIWIQAVCVAAGNSATVAFQGDGPFIGLQQITFQDANQKPIVGPLNGYQLMIVNKYGGYQFQDDPRASVVYSVTTGAGGSGGSFTFILYVPLEIVARDTLGALQNKSASSAFQLLITVNTLANLYSTAPTAAPSLTITLLEDGWVQPKGQDATGNPLQQAPPQLGTTQYWTVGTYNSLNGSQQIQLTQGLGYPVRNFVALNYDVATSTRATGDTDWPTATSFIFRGTTYWNVTKTVWKDQMGRLYGFIGSTADAANGLENGVYALCFDQDFGLQDGAELRTGYLPSQQGDQHQLIATFNGNSNLQWMANYAAPIAGPSNLASIQAGR
jgi:hypothetical protein